MSMNHKQLKSLSNKAEGIYHYIGPQNTLMAMIQEGNQLASAVNNAVAVFIRFNRDGTLSDWETRSMINRVVIHMGNLLCLLDVIHAAAGELIHPEVSDAVQHAYQCKYQELLRQAVINGLPDDYKGPEQNPYIVNLRKPAIAFMGEFDDDFDTGEFESFASEEEPRERCLKVRCTGGEFESIKRYCYALELKPYEEDLKNE